MSYGVVAELWRFPVKSMGGEQVAALRITRRGAHADRLWAVRDLEREQIASARRVPALLMCSARYLTEPGPAAGPGRAPDVMITLPSGERISSADAGVHDALSEVAGRPVRLVPLPARRDTSLHRLSLRQIRSTVAVANIRKELGLADDEELPDARRLRLADVLTLTRFSTPPGTFADLAPIHVLTRTSLATLASSVPDADVDVRRFRPGLLVEPHDPRPGTLPEADWPGMSLTTPGTGLKITMPTVRCVVPSRAQTGLPVDRDVSRALTATGRYLGAYADVTREGLVRAGDPVALGPSPAQRSWLGAGGRERLTQRGLEQILGLLLRRTR